MTVEIIPAAHHLILRDGPAPELNPGDAVAFTINAWEEGEREITAEVVRETAPGQVKLRIGSGPAASFFVVPAQACALVLAAAHRRAA